MRDVAIPARDLFEIVHLALRTKTLDTPGIRCQGEVTARNVRCEVKFFVYRGQVSKLVEHGANNTITNVHKTSTQLIMLYYDFKFQWQEILRISP